MYIFLLRNILRKDVYDIFQWFHANIDSFRSVSAVCGQFLKNCCKIRLENKPTLISGLKNPAYKKVPE